MGVYIKGMEMPSSGCIKMLIILGNGHVIETTPGCDPQPGAQNYAAVPVPPHGRLIDGDALCKKLKIMYAQAFCDGNSAYHSAYRSLEKIINDAPTVLERSEV